MCEDFCRREGMDPGKIDWTIDSPQGWLDDSPPSVPEATVSENQAAPLHDVPSVDPPILPPGASWWDNDDDFASQTETPLERDPSPVPVVEQYRSSQHMGMDRRRSPDPARYPEVETASGAMKTLGIGITDECP